jgi:hypothetical protein
MLKKILASKVGQAALAGLVMILLSYGARVYYDQKTQDPVKFRAQTTSETLERARDALSAAAARRAEGDPTLPASTPWVPAALLCGEEAAATPEEAAHPTWATLGLAWDKPQRYQYRFRALDQERFELLARADEDCDGVYQVHRLRGAVTWTGLSAEKITLDNPNE